MQKEEVKNFERRGLVALLESANNKVFLAFVFRPGGTKRFQNQYLMLQLWGDVDLFRQHELLTFGRSGGQARFVVRTLEQH